MTKKQPIVLIIFLGIIFTLVINLNLTKAIFYDGYLNNREITFGGEYYLSLLNESSKGNWNLGSPFIKEWARKEYLYPALNIHITGLFKRIFNLDLKTASVILSYGCIFIIAVLAIFIFLLAFRFHYFGYLAAAAFLFFPRTIGWGQVISPQTNFLFLMIFLLFYFCEFKFWKREIGLAVSAGLLFYTYPYHWTYALPLLVFSDSWEFFKTKNIDWRRTVKYPAILFIAVWYLAHLWNISHLAYYRETMVRIGALYNRFPAGLLTQVTVILMLLFFGLLYKYFFATRNFRVPFNLSKIVIGLLVTFVVLNQQLITGMQLEFNSHYLPVILVFAIGLIGATVLILSENIQRSRLTTATAVWLTVLFFVGQFTYINIKDSFGNPPNRLNAKELETVEWFIKNKVTNQVVYAPRLLNAPVNLLAGNYLYFHDSQEVQLMPTEELIDRFTYFDILNRDITDNLISQQVQIFGQTFKSSWQKDNVINRIKTFLTGRQFSPATLESYTKYDFGPMRQKRLRPDIEDFKAHLKKYNVDYLIYEAKRRYEIYKDIPGDIVFDNGVYIIKSI